MQNKDSLSYRLHRCNQEAFCVETIQSHISSFWKRVEKQSTVNKLPPQRCSREKGWVSSPNIECLRSKWMVPATDVLEKSHEWAAPEVFLGFNQMHRLSFLNRGPVEKAYRIIIPNYPTDWKISLHGVLSARDGNGFTEGDPVRLQYFSSNSPPVFPEKKLLSSVLVFLCTSYGNWTRWVLHRSDTVLEILITFVALSFQAFSKTAVEDTCDKRNIALNPTDWLIW